MNINGRIIGPGHPPYIVADLGASHLGSFERALTLVRMARDAGADAVKTQCYTPDSLAVDDGTVMQDGPWKGRSLYDLYKEAHTPMAWQPKIFEYAASLGLTAFASVFDFAGIDLMESLDCPAYKIASFEITDLELIEYAGNTDKPIIISTGMASADEIAEAWSVLVDAPCLLHCVSGYPTPPQEANLARMARLRATHIDGLAGISDHSLGSLVPIAATALGAVLIEKHITLARADGGPDAAFSLEPHELAAMVRDVKITWQAMQESKSESEQSSRPLRGRTIRARMARRQWGAPKGRVEVVG